MKKKLICALLSACMILGCSIGALADEEIDMNEDGTINNPEAVKVEEGDLSFWSLFTGGDGEWFGQIASDYNDTDPDYPIQVITLVWDDYYTKLQTAVATGNGPDTGVSHVSKLYELAETGVVEPLDDYLDELGIDLTEYYTEDSLESVTFDGSIYAIPLDTHAEVLYYNLDILEEAGITEDDVAAIASADDFEALLDKCKETMPDDYSALSLTNSGDDPFRTWYALYFQMGGTPFINDDATEVTLDEDIAREAMEYLKSLYDNGYILQGISDCGQFFQSGKAAFCIGGTWLTGTFGETEGLNFNNAEFPLLFGDTNYCWADSHTLVLPVNPDRTDEESLSAVNFLFWASDKGGLTWAGSGQIPAAVEVNQSDEYKEEKGYRVVGELGLAVYAPLSTGYYGGMKPDMIAALDSYWQDVNDLDTAYEQLYDAIADNLD